MWKIRKHVKLLVLIQIKRNFVGKFSYIRALKKCITLMDFHLQVRRYTTNTIEIFSFFPVLAHCFANSKDKTGRIYKIFSFLNLKQNFQSCKKKLVWKSYPVKSYAQFKFKFLKNSIFPRFLSKKVRWLFRNYKKTLQEPLRHIYICLKEYTM